MSPKATIRFDLSDPDDRMEFRLAQQAGKWQAIVWDLDQWLRETTKHDVPLLTIEDMRAYEQGDGPSFSVEQLKMISPISLEIAHKVRGKIVELMTDSEVSFDS
jgi:hypothetical protein